MSAESVESTVNQMTLPEMEHPTPEQQAALLIDSEARADRRAWRVGQKAVDFSERMLGRRRPLLLSKDEGLFSELTVIEFERVEKLGQRIQQNPRHEPIYDEFTKRNRVDLHPEALDRFILSGNVKSARVRKAKEASGEKDPLTEQQRKAANRRQTQHIADRFQQGVFDDLNIARLRRQALRTARVQIKRGQPLDAQVATLAADSVLDLGWSLMENKKILKDIGDADLGRQIAVIGERAFSHRSLLAANEPLLRLAQNEQATRVDYWQPRLDLAKRFWGFRLTKQNRADGARTDAMIAQLQSVEAEARL